MLSMVKVGKLDNAEHQDQDTRHGTLYTFGSM